MPQIKDFDHVGITVADLDIVTAFFVGLGFEVEGRAAMAGEFVDTVIGIPDSRSEIVTLRPPGGGTGLELSSFSQPSHQAGSPNAMSTELGLRNICFAVDDLKAIVDRLSTDGYGLRRRPDRRRHPYRARRSPLRCTGPNLLLKVRYARLCHTTWP